MTRVWRKRVKVIGLLLCIMMLALRVFSVMFVSRYVPSSSPWVITITFGRIGFADFQGINPGRTCSRFYPQWKVVVEEMPWTEFAHAWLGFVLPGRTVDGIFHTPVWLLVVAVGFPTAILWWRDRPKAGFCKVCKYDLTGNVSGRCPECGTAVDASAHGAKPPIEGA